MPEPPELLFRDDPPELLLPDELPEWLPPELLLPDELPELLPPELLPPELLPPEKPHPDESESDSFDSQSAARRRVQLGYGPKARCANLRQTMAQARPARVPHGVQVLPSSVERATTIAAWELFAAVAEINMYAA